MQTLTGTGCHSITVIGGQGITWKIPTGKTEDTAPVHWLGNSNPDFSPWPLADTECYDRECLILLLASKAKDMTPHVFE